MLFDNTDKLLNTAVSYGSGWVENGCRFLVYISRQSLGTLCFTHVRLYIPPYHLKCNTRSVMIEDHVSYQTFRLFPLWSYAPSFSLKQKVWFPLNNLHSLEAILLKFILQLCFDHNSQFKLEFGYYFKIMFLN